MGRESFKGNRELITHTNVFMGSVLCEVLAEQTSSPVYFGRHYPR
jgi:hypothetical protein